MMRRRNAPSVARCAGLAGAARRRLIAALVAAVSLGLGLPAQAAEAPAATPATAKAAAAAQTFAITISDGRFQPERIDVPAGIKLRLELTNLGPGPLEFENAEMHVEKVLAAGARSVVVLPPLSPGEYSFIDEFNPITGELKLIAK